MDGSWTSLMKTPLGDGSRLTANFARKSAAPLPFRGDVMQLDPLEFVLELAHLLVVCCHEGAFVGGLLHDLINDQLRVAANVEPRSTKLDGDA